MPQPVIAITSDHAGFELKALLLKSLEPYASHILDLGPEGSSVSVDYTDYAALLAQKMLSGEAEFGVAICGSGIGMSIALNRHKGIRAALCHDGLSASLSRRHNNANILCLGARLMGTETALDCVYHFFTAAFEGGRHNRRMEKLQ